MGRGPKRRARRWPARMDICVFYGNLHNIIFFMISYHIILYYTVLRGWRTKAKGASEAVRMEYSYILLTFNIKLYHILVYYIILYILYCTVG